MITHSSEIYQFIQIFLQHRIFGETETKFLFNFCLLTGARVGDVLLTIKDYNIKTISETEFNISYIQQKTKIYRDSNIQKPQDLKIEVIRSWLNISKLLSYSTHQKNFKSGIYPHRVMSKGKDITTHLPRHYFIKKGFEEGKTYSEMKILTGISSISTLNEYRYSTLIIT